MTQSGSQALVVTDTSGKTITGSENWMVEISERPVDGSWSDDFGQAQDWKMGYPVMLGDLRVELISDQTLNAPA